MTPVHSRRVPLLLAATLATTLVLAVVAAPRASADDVECTGTIGATTVDNVVVPQGASCVLDGTTVEGNVIVNTGATLRATGARIDGNVQGEGARDVVVENASTVGGSVQVEQGAAAAVRDSRVDADVQFESNDAALAVQRTDVGGNVQVNQNAGGADIRDNTIDGNLQCQANTPAPTGGGNVVRGSAEDQCANLTGTPSGEPDPSESPSPAPTASPTASPTSSPPPPPDDDDDGGDDDDDDVPAPGRTTGRLAGPDRITTSVAISASQFPDGAPVAYLARADSFPDALAGGVLTRGPILLVPACGELPAPVAQEINRLGAREVVALGGEAAVCTAILDAAAAA